MVSALDCTHGRAHAFDPDSGWCAHGCGVRDDKHVVNRAGTVIRRGIPAPSEDIRHRIDPKGDD